MGQQEILTVHKFSVLSCFLVTVLMLLVSGALKILRQFCVSRKLRELKTKREDLAQFLLIPIYYFALFSKIHNIDFNDIL